MPPIKKKHELTGHAGAIYALASGENKNCFYSGSSDKMVAKWNMETYIPEKFAAQLPGIVYSLCYIAAKNILLIGTSEGKIHVLDLVKNIEIKTLYNNNKPVFDIQYESVILSAGGDGVLSLLSLEDFTTKKLLKICAAKLRSIAIYSGNVAIACGDGFIRIFNIQEAIITNEYAAHTGSVYAVQFSPDGKYLLSGGKDAHLNIWKSTNIGWNLVKSIPAHNYAIYSIVFSPDGKYFATASRDKTIKIWNADTFEILVRINKENYNGHSFSVNKLLWCSNNLLLSAGDDKKILIWQIS